MIKNLKREMYLYSVQQRLLRDTYYIKREVLLDVGKLMVGDSKKHNSWHCSNHQDNFDRTYWKTPEEAFKNWKKRAAKNTKEQLTKLEKEYKAQKKELESHNNTVSSLEFEDLKIDTRPDDWEPCCY
jgi:hypothetical protein